MQDRSLVDIVQFSSAQRQRMLISLLAICHQFRIDPVVLVGEYAKELARTPLENRRRTRNFYWSRVERLGQGAENGESLCELLERDTKLVPAIALLAKFDGEVGEPNKEADVAESDRTLGRPAASPNSNGFAKTWLNRPVDQTVQVDETRTGIQFLILMINQLLIVGGVASLIYLFIWPSLYELAEELGMAKSSMSWSFVDTGWGQWAILFPYLLIPFALFTLFCFRKRIFRSLNPLTWRQNLVDREAKARFLFSQIVLGAVDDEVIEQHGLEKYGPMMKPNHSGPMDWRQLLKHRLLRPREVAALEAAATIEVQSWLLLKFAAARQRKNNRRIHWIANLLIGFVYIAMASLILAMVGSVFLFLISIIRQLLRGA